MSIVKDTQGNFYYSADEMNKLVAKHNQIIDALLREWARMFILVTRTMRVDREKVRDYDRLLEAYNQLLIDSQMSRLLHDENEYLWQVNIDLHRMIESEIKNDVT